MSKATVGHFEVASRHTEVPPAVGRAGDEGDGWGTSGWGNPTITRLSALRIVVVVTGSDMLVEMGWGMWRAHSS